MTDRRPVELVRVEREEEYFEREEVLGRDAASVFPTEAKKAALDPEALKAVIGGDRKFISATELEEIKKKRGLTVEDGTLAPSKPLAEVLREAKEKKQQEFEDMWKQMKQGKNRPLDEDELDFLDSVANATAEQERAARQQEEQELAAFQEALRQQQEEKAAEEAKAAASHKLHAGPQHKRQHPAVKPRAKPAVVIVKQASSEWAGGEVRQQPIGSSEREPWSNDAGALQLARKRQRADAEGPGPGARTQLSKAVQQQHQQQQRSGAIQEEDIGLPGLLGGYGSGSDSED